MRLNTKVFLILLAANLLLHIPVLAAGHEALLNWYLTDDAFYYFKTAQNIAESGFISYDGIAPTNGFHPLWMMICVPVFALARFDLYLPLKLLILVQVVLNAASGYLLYRLFAEYVNQPAAWLVAVVWMFMPSIHGITTKLGLETGVNAFSLIWLLFCAANLYTSITDSTAIPIKKILMTAVAAISVLFSRLDNIFLLMMLGLWLVFRRSRLRWLSMIDLLLNFLSVIVSYFLRLQGTVNLFEYLSFAYVLIALSMVIKPLCLYFFGLYAPLDSQNSKRIIFSIFFALTLSSALIGLIIFILHDKLGLITGFPRAVLLMDYGISILLVLIVRLLVKKRDDFISPLNEDISLSHNWQEWFSTAAAFFLPVLGALGLYMAINHAYAGSAMPVSGQIKRWWGTLPNTVYGQPIRSLSGTFGGLLDTEQNEGPFWLLTRPLYLLADWLSDIFSLPSDTVGSPHILMQVLVWSAFLAFILVVIQVNGRRLCELAERFNLLPIVCGSIIHALSYKASAYLHVRSWYWISQMLLVVVCAGLVIGVLIERFQKRKSSSKSAGYATILLSLALMVNFGHAIVSDFPLNGKIITPYAVDNDIEFITAHTQPGDVIGLTGGGYLGYFMPQRTIVNLDGLINSADYFELVKENKVNEYHRSIGTDYIYGDPIILLDSDPYRWTYTNHLKFVAEGPYFQLFEYCTDECQ